MKNRLPVLILAGVLILGGLAGLLFFKSKKSVPLPPATKPLEVAGVSPDKGELPISIEGITVLFNQPVISLSTLDSSKKPKVDLKITPAVEGRIRWLGTTGFIFEPKTHFTPATSYNVQLPAFTAENGAAIKQSMEWNFETVKPRVQTLTGSDFWLPGKSTLRLRFNMAMNTDDVEKKFTVESKEGTPLKLKPSFEWSEGNRELAVRIGGELPSEAEFTVKLPEGLISAYGSLGSAEAFEQVFQAPPAELAINSVEIEGSPLKLDQIEAAQRGQGVCYAFNQPIEKASFEKAFHLETSGSKSVPHFYYRGMREFSVPGKNRLEAIEGYDQACIAFLEQYAQNYVFWVEGKDLRSLSGAKFNGAVARYKILTDHAVPQITSFLTQNLLSSANPAAIPYETLNLNSARVKFFAIGRENYSESVKNEMVSAQTETDPATNEQVPVTPLVSHRLTDTNLSLPLAPGGFMIDENRMPSVASRELKVTSSMDIPSALSLDVKSFNLQPGLYLIELSGIPVDTSLAVPPSVYSIVQLAPAALAVKREVDHFLAWATDVETGKPLSNVEVQFYKRDTQQGLSLQDLHSGKTDSAGILILPNSMGDAGWSASLCAGADNGAYACELQHTLGSTRYNLTAGDHAFVYVTTDRPIYRPGQTVFFSSFIRQVKEGRYFAPKEGVTAKITAVDAAGEVIFERADVSLEKGGVVSGKFELSASEEIPRGNYSVSIKIGKQEFSRVFVVSSYKKPSFKVDLELTPKELVSRDPFELTVKGGYFFGAPLPKAKTQWSIMTSTYVFAPEGYENFSFLDDDLVFQRQSEDGYAEYYSDYDSSYVDFYARSEDSSNYDDPRDGSQVSSPSGFFKDAQKKPVKNVKGQLDDKGELTVQYEPDLAVYPTSQRLLIEASVEDPTRQSVSNSVEVIAHKANVYLGVKPEKWVYGENDKARLEVISLDTKGAPLEGVSFKAEVFRREYQFLERRNAKGYWETLVEPKDIEVDDFSEKTGAKGLGEIEFKIPQGGTYRVVVKATDKSGNTAQSAAYIDAWGEGYIPWKINEPEKIELAPDKKQYAVGDTARILVKSLVPVTQALLTMERGRILDAKVVPLGGVASVIEIPITEGMIPNLYLNVIAPAGRDKNRSPMLFFGEAELAIEPESKRLQIAIKPNRAGDDAHPAIYRPGEEVKVTLETSDNKGKPTPAHVIVSVADESVLRLLNYNLPDLVKKFFFKRPNLVSSFSSLVSLKAGDGGMSSSKKRRLFKDTAHFEAHLVTNENGKAEFAFKLPDDLTTWVIEAVAITDSKSLAAFESERSAKSPPSSQKIVETNLALSDGTLVGSQRAKIQTTLPVAVRAALPRFLAWGDKVKGQIAVNNQNPDSVSGTIEVRLSGEGLNPANATLSPIAFDLAGNSEKTYPLPLEVDQIRGRLTLEAIAKNKEGQTLDHFEISLPVTDRSAPETVATQGQTTDSAKETIDLPKEIDSTRGGLTTTVKSSLGLAIVPDLKQLISFPYGCSEQKSAHLLALLMTEDLAERTNESYIDQIAPFTDAEKKAFKGAGDRKKAVRQRIDALITELTTKFNDENGGIKYWPDSYRADLLPTVQTLWARALAQENGHAFDANAFPKIGAYLRGALKAADLSSDQKAYALWGLALTGEWDLEAEGKLNDAIARMSDAGIAYFLLAVNQNLASAPMATTSPQDLIARLTALAKRESRTAQWPASYFIGGTAVKNTALAAWALLEADAQHPLLQPAFSFLTSRKQTRPVVNTQESLYASFAAYRYFTAANPKPIDFDATVTVGGQSVLKQHFNADNALESVTQATSMADLKKLPRPSDLIFAKQGDGTLYYDATLQYYLPIDQIPTREEGILITREYFSLDDAMEAHPLTKFEAGKNYKGHITVIVPEDLNYGIIQELLPAGFEAIDMTLAISSRSAGLDAAAEPEYEPEPDADARPAYDDEIRTADYGMDYGFSHQEIRDDSIIWSDEYLPAGTYHVRYPVRATTSGQFIVPGATAFGFYNPEIFGRSRTKMAEITGN